MLKLNGLISFFIYVMLYLFRVDLEVYLDVVDVLGYKYIVVFYLMLEDCKSIEDYYSLIDEMNVWGEKCK